MKEFEMDIAVEKAKTALEAIVDNLKDEDEVSRVSALRAIKHIEDIIPNLGVANRK